MKTLKIPTAQFMVAASLSTFVASANTQGFAQTPCTGAVDLTAETIPFLAMNHTDETSEGMAAPCNLEDTSGPELWYQLPDLNNGTTYVIATGAGDEGDVSLTAVAVYAGGCEEGNLVACSAGTYDSGFAEVQFTALDAGPWYAMVEMRVPGQAGDFILSVTEFSDISVDSMCDSSALPVDEVPFEFLIDVLGGDDLQGVPCASDTGGSDYWLELPAVQGGAIYTVETEFLDGSDTTDTRLAIYAGSSCSTAVPVVCNDDIDELTGNLFSRVDFVADESNTYWVFAETASPGQDGAFNLLVSKADPVVGETCERRQYLDASGAPLDVTVSLTEDRSVVAAECALTATGADQWYEIQNTAVDVLYTVETMATDPVSIADTNLVLYEGSCGSLVPVACNDDIDTGTNDYSQLTFLGTGGDPLFLLVEAAQPESVGTVKLSLTASSPLSAPANDECRAATAINPALLPFSDTVNASQANDSGPFALPGEAEDGPDVFYTFNPLATGGYLVSGSFTGDAEGMSIGVYTSEDCVDFTPVCGSPATGGEPILVAYLTQGVTYYIIADAPAMLPVVETFTVELDGPLGTTPSPNSDCANATLVTGYPFDDSQDPSANPSSLDIAGLLGGQYCVGELYYKLSPTTDEAIRVSAGATNGESCAIGLYEGSCGALSLAARYAVDDAVFSLEGGNDYYLVVEPWAADTGGGVSVSINGATLPSNDACADALVIPSVPYELTVDVLAAEDEGLEGTCDYSQEFEARKDVLWTFTPSSTGLYRIDAGVPGLLGSGPNTAISVFTGACADPREIACIDRTAAGEFIVVELDGGVQVFILVDVKDLLVGSSLPDDELITMRLDVVSDPVGIDNCDDAFQVTNETMPFSQTVDLSAHNPHPFLGFGPVQAYEVSSTRYGNVIVSAEPQADGNDVSIVATNATCGIAYLDYFLGSEEASTANEAGARGGEETGMEVLELPILSGETMVLYIFSVDADGGPVDVDMVFEERMENWALF